jgi:hypothetical protein
LDGLTSPKPPEEQPDDATTSLGRQRAEVIRAGVLAALGRPAELFRVNVMPLWGDNYRVNVLIGEDATAVKIPNSFFVTVDDRGAILKSTPPIQKQY